MIRRWWLSLGFYWQVYIFMVAAFGGIIMVAEGVAEPFVLTLLEERFRLGDRLNEIILWIVSVFVPTLALGFLLTHMVMWKMTGMVDMARRLSGGDLSARIQTSGSGNDVFNQMAHVFNDMAESLEGLLAHEKRLLADISHELRSPLTRMGMAAALLPMKETPDEIAAIGNIFDDEINQMNALVGMLLQHARDRLDSHGSYSRIDLSELAGESARANSFLAADKGVRIDAEIGQGILVWGQAVRLRMIIDNIVINAIFYSPAGSAIAMKVEQDSEHVSISIRDHGPGVPEKHLRDIFRAFFRVDQSRARASGGVGLGLALAYDAAVAMGGEITARNDHPGLEVNVTLPRPLLPVQ